ncbi:hypothetical protein CGMCC3_g17882 [Colletotrichum fructicola]|nr:uncharacterized protein CGMCC3_g17882 [Colletotrichum fructicola]KAE9565938.1 hypothetical protein CGMCC3_g17882 [Colletotrichum fructicola]
MRREEQLLRGTKATEELLRDVFSQLRLITFLLRVEATCSSDAESSLVAWEGVRQEVERLWIPLLEGWTAGEPGGSVLIDTGAGFTGLVREFDHLPEEIQEVVYVSAWSVEDIIIAHTLSDSVVAELLPGAEERFSGYPQGYVFT